MPAKRRQPGHPLLQVALDFLDLDRALKVAKAAAAGGADWLEAGTPLIKSEGLQAVRTLKQQFPDHVIVADMKTMDAGRAEVEAAAKAGAGVVHVLAAASDATIGECVEASRNVGTKIVVDLINIPDPVARARQVEALGADYIGVHCPVDVQMLGQDPFAGLREIVAAVGLPVTFAGGIHSENAAGAVAAGARVVVVGGAITKADDPEQATRNIRQALDTGAAVSTELFKRAGQESILEVLHRVSTANISDAMHRGGATGLIRPLAPQMRVAGRALTVRTAPGDFAKPVEAIDEAEPGDVIVVDVGGVGPAIWGELATWSARNRQVAGVIVDGAVRDTADIIKMGFPAFSRLVMPNAGEPRGFGEIGVPIEIAGLPVKTGDWVVGDADGVAVLPRERAVEWANRAMDVLERENRIRQEIKEGGTLGEVTHLLQWEKRG